MSLSRGGFGKAEVFFLRKEGGGGNPRDQKAVLFRKERRPLAFYREWGGKGGQEGEEGEKKKIGFTSLGGDLSENLFTKRILFKSHLFMQEKKEKRGRWHQGGGNHKHYCFLVGREKLGVSVRKGGLKGKKKFSRSGCGLGGKRSK